MMQLLLTTNNVNRHIVNLIQGDNFVSKVPRVNFEYDLLVTNNQGLTEDTALEGTILALIPKEKTSHIGSISAIDVHELLPTADKIMIIYNKHDLPIKKGFTKIDVIINIDDIVTGFIDIKNKDRLLKLLVDFFLSDKNHSSLFNES